MQETQKTRVLIPMLGRSPGGGHGNPLQYSCLENPRGQRRLGVIVPGVVKSQAQLNDYSMYLSISIDLLFIAQGP